MNNFEELILAALQTKFAGVDAKILGRIAKKLSKTATKEEDVQTIVDGVTFQQVIESHADYRATEAQKTAVANYEAKHNLRDGKPTEAPQPKPQPGNAGGNGSGQQTHEEVPAYIQQLIDETKALKEELNSYKTERTANTRLNAFREAIKTAPDKVRERYEKDFTRLNFKDDDDFNSYLEEIKPDITAMAEAASKQGAKVGGVLGGNGNGDEPSALVKARFDAAKADTAIPAIQGLPTANPT